MQVAETERAGAAVDASTFDLPAGSVRVRLGVALIPPQVRRILAPRAPPAGACFGQHGPGRAPQGDGFQVSSRLANAATPLRTALWDTLCQLT